MALLPEWAPVDVIVLAWPYEAGDWGAHLERANECYWSLLCALTQASKVCVLLHPSLNKYDMQQNTAGLNLPSERVSWLSYDYDDTWVRDYGPLSTQTGLVSLTFNGWGQKYPAGKDNQLFHCLSQAWITSIRKHDFVGEGGAFETNGKVLLMNAGCVIDHNRNPGLDCVDVEKKLQDIFPELEPIWLSAVALTGDDTDGHIDTIVRFANESTLVYSGRNPTHIDAQTLDHLHNQVQALANQHAWQTIELPTPEVSSPLDGRILPATYANFLIANQYVFVPIYDVDQDKQALELLSKAFSNRKIIAVRCEALLEQHGSLHCATIQIARQKR